METVCHVVVACLSGETILEADVPCDEHVSDLTQRVAELLNWPAEQMMLTDGGAELEAAQIVSKVVDSGVEGTREGHRTVNIIAVRLPCVARPSEYELHIQRHAKGALVVGRYLKFPKSQGIWINMMPFVMGSKASIPKKYHHYWPMIEACPIDDDQKGKVGYLTISENYVAPGEKQRRGRLHVDRPQMSVKAACNYCHGFGSGRICFDEYGEWDWYGGLYVASNVSNSTMVWDLQVKPGVIGHLGDLEHLRDMLGEGRKLDANELVWLTDVTPHESLPIENGGHRQFFRLITSGVGCWYEQHSTRNPLGTEPDPSLTKIFTHDKFAEVGPDVGLKISRCCGGCHTRP